MSAAHIAPGLPGEIKHPRQAGGYVYSPHTSGSGAVTVRGS